jgi:hypothetical protein
MFGDLPASQICGPIVATLPNLSQQILTPGSMPVLPKGTKLNVDLFVRNVPGVPGGVIPAGQPLPQDIPLTEGVPQTRRCPPIPVVGRGAFKISDNESPLPRDRVFGTYDYFNNLNGGFRTPGVIRSDLHREIIGFEKTFLDQRASVGLRLPFLQVTGDSVVEKSDIGDLAIILKYAFYLDRAKGNVLSGGLLVSAPTGANFLPTGSPDIHPTQLQPFVGGIYTTGDLYVQGFSSINVPTDSRDVTYLFNDLSVGYFLYRDNAADRLITAVTPTLEFHVNTPLNHRGSFVQPIPGLDIVDMTAGTWFTLHKRSLLGLGGVIPLTGPHPLDFQILAQFNHTF